MAKVGIYAPSYNVDKYIKQMINSIVGQTHKDWVLGILDDGSTDNSYEVALELAKTDSRIIVKRNDGHDGRIGFIKNETIKLLGDVDYLASVDSDDFISPIAVKLFHDFLENNKEFGAACGNFTCFSDDGKQWNYPHVSNSGDFDSKTLLRYMNYFPMRFCRKSLFDIVGGYDQNLTSAIDYDMALKLDEVCKIKRIKEPVTYFYRQHRIQVSTKSRPEQDNNAKKALEAAVNRRGLDLLVCGDKPPFELKPKESHFIWGKK